MSCLLADMLFRDKVLVRQTSNDSNLVQSLDLSPGFTSGWAVVTGEVLGVSSGHRRGVSSGHRRGVRCEQWSQERC